MTKPMISVIMPVYNGEKYLKEAIDSILNQTYTDFEFIILNDGSTDRTEEIILSYSEPRIVYIKNKKNLQIAKTLNKGISLAKGKYIARMDADDISLPERFEKQVAILEGNHKFQVIFTYVQLINDEGNVKGDWYDDINCTNKIKVGQVLPKRNCFAHPSMMALTTLLHQYQYEIKSDKSEDYNLWLRMFSNGVVFYKIKERLLKYRVHPGSETQNSSQLLSAIKKNSIAKWYHLQYKIIQKHQINLFDMQVFKYLLIDIKQMLIVFLRASVKASLIKAGSVIYTLFPIKLESKIILFFPFYHMGGAERVHSDIIEAIRELKPIVVISDKSRDEIFLHRFQQAVRIIDVSSLRKNKLLRLLLLGYWASLLNSKGSGKIIFTSNSTFFYDLLDFLEEYIIAIDLIHAFGGGIEQYSLPMIEKIKKRIIINKQTYKDLENFYSKNMISDVLLKRVELIENAVQIPAYIKKKGQSHFNIMYIGRESQEKRVYLIGKIASLCKNKLPVTFTFIGDVENAVREEDRNACVFIVKNNNMERYYRVADFLILTSSREGFPMVIMEAMSYGVIPISTNVGGIHYHVKNGYNGCLVNNGSEEMIVADILSEIEILITDKLKRDMMSKNAYDYACENFSSKTFTHKYLKLFR